MDCWVVGTAALQAQEPRAEATVAVAAWAAAGWAATGVEGLRAAGTAVGAETSVVIVGAMAERRAGLAE